MRRRWSQQCALIGIELQRLVWIRWKSRSNHTHHRGREKRQPRPAYLVHFDLSYPMQRSL